MSSEKGKRLTVRFEQGFYDEVKNYRKSHGISTWVKALHSRDKETIQKSKKQEARIVELETRIIEVEKEPKDQLSWLKKKGISMDEPLEHDVSKVKEIPKGDCMEFSDVECEALGHDKNGKPFCIDPNAPISTEARRHFNWEVCRFCQKMKNREHEKHQKEQDRKMKQTRERQQREVSRLQKSINETVAKEETSKRGSIYRGGSTDGHW